MICFAREGPHTAKRRHKIVTNIVTLLHLVVPSAVIIYATADEEDAYMLYRCFFLSLFCFFFVFFPSVKKIPDNPSRERLNGFS